MFCHVILCFVKKIKVFAQVCWVDRAMTFLTPDFMIITGTSEFCRGLQKTGRGKRSLFVLVLAVPVVPRWSATSWGLAKMN